MLRKKFTAAFATLLFVIAASSVTHAASADTSGVMGYDDMINVLNRLEAESNGQLEVFTLDEYGIDNAFSEAGRDLYVAKIGNGDKTVWVQGRIHGNEPYGTNTVLRTIENLMNASDEQYAKVMEEMTIYFIPMYNPDGAENNQRGTILYDHETGEPKRDSNGRLMQIDLNRDWLENGFAARESLAYYELWTDIKPEFMLDLHHQGIPTFPESKIPVTMSLGISLAPGGPTLPNIKGGEYDVLTRQTMGYAYNELSKYKEYTVDRYRVGAGGTLEIDIHGGLTSAMMLGLNYENMNPDNHSHPAVFLEASGQFIDGEREPLIEQNMIATKAILYGVASGEVHDVDPDIWFNIPAPELKGYNTDHSGTVPAEKPAVLAPVSAEEIKNIVDRYAEIGRFSNDASARQLQVHLESLSHLENSGNLSKVEAHLDGLHHLLDHQNDNDLITGGSYETLKAYTDYFNDQLSKEAVPN